MARIVVATVPVIGHVNPFLPVVRGLIARGHDVRWYSGAKYRARIEATGAAFVGTTHARDFDDASIDEAFAGRRAHSGLGQLKFDMKHVFIDNAPGQLSDLREIVRAFDADAVFCDPAMLGALFHSELTPVPTVVLSVLPMVVSSVDTAPFGFALQPAAHPLGRARNRALNWAAEHVLFRDVQRHWNATRAGCGLGPTGYWLDAAPARSALCLQPSIASFEYPRSDLPANVRFIGMLPPEALVDWHPPSFWAELDAGRPVIHVTQGTIANQSPQLIRPALAGLANEDVLVVVATGGRSIEDLGLRDVPRNARIERFVSYPALLPKTAAMVTNGGYGGVQLALSHGVPLVVAGSSEDKPEVAARVAWSGAGIDLRTATPTPERVRTAVRALLDDARYRTRARALCAEYARHDAVARAIELLEGTVFAFSRLRSASAAQAKRE